MTAKTYTELVMTIKYSIEAGVSATAFVVTLGKAGAKMGGTGGAAVLVAEVDVATAGVSLFATGINVLLATQAGDQYNRDKQKLEGAGKSISSKLKAKIDDIRSKMPNTNLSKRGNMAAAEADIPAVKSEYVAHSKINSALDKGSDVAEFSYLKPENERIFKSYVDDGFPRYHDTEAKILEDIASQIKDPNVSGTINLYSGLPCCQSCTNIIYEFRKMFPNIELNVFVWEIGGR